jgi:hypothetical protein
MIGEQTGRALTLISGIETCKQVDPGFWQSVATRIVMDLDERGEHDSVRMVADMLADVWNRLEGKRGVASLAPPPPGDPAVSAYLARRATCRHCGEPGLVPSPAVLGVWLSDRQGTGRGLCPDGETMHQAENITEGES